MVNQSHLSSFTLSLFRHLFFLSLIYFFSPTVRILKCKKREGKDVEKNINMMDTAYKIRLWTICFPNKKQKFTKNERKKKVRKKQVWKNERKKMWIVNQRNGIVGKFFQKM